jgi:hypothetical protein
MIDSNAWSGDDGALNIVDKHTCAFWVWFDASGNRTVVIEANEDSSIVFQAECCCGRSALIEFVTIQNKVFLAVWTIDKETIRLVVPADGYALLAESFRNTIMVTCTIPLDFEIHGAEKMEQHTIVSLDTMNKFKGCGEFVVYFAWKVVDHLGGMTQCPEPVCSWHLHIGDVSLSHCHDGLPPMFN